MHTENLESLKPIRKIIEEITGLDPAPILNLMNFESSIELADYLGLSPASLSNLLSGEPDSSAGNVFGLRQSDLDNLYEAYGEKFGLGMLIGMLCTKRDELAPK